MNSKYKSKIRRFISIIAKHRGAVLYMLALFIMLSFVSVVCTEVHTKESLPECAVTAPAPSEIVAPYTEDELFCLAAAIYNEAGGDECSDDTRRLVGYVILNRVNDSRFPNTIREVLEAKGQYGRFYYTGVQFADRGDSYEESYAQDRAYFIAEEILRSRDNIPIPPTVVFQSEYEQGVGIYKYQDGLYFCYAEEVN